MRIDLQSYEKKSLLFLQNNINEYYTLEINIVNFKTLFRR